MENTIRLLLVALIPAAVSVFMYYLQKKTDFKILPDQAKQIIFGVVFGLTSISGTILGVELEGATANVRDAGVLCAGLFFGAPAGIIAGLMSGIHRWLSAAWAGEYTKVACSVATIMAGFYAAALRIYMFDQHRPNWSMAALVSVVVEVIHMVLVYLTHIEDTHRVYQIIQVVTFPMIISNAFAVAASAEGIDLLSARFHEWRKRVPTLATKIQKWLMLAIVVAFLLTTTFTFAMQTSESMYSAENLLKTNIQDVGCDIQERADSHMMTATKQIAARYEADNHSNARLSLYQTLYRADEINIVDENCVVTYSTNPDNIGYNLQMDTNLNAFDCLNHGSITYIRDNIDSSAVTGIGRNIGTYVGQALRTGGFIQVGFAKGAFKQKLKEDITDIVRNRRIGQDGYILVVDEKGTIMGDELLLGGTSLSFSGIDFGGAKPGEMVRCTAYYDDTYCMYDEAEGFLLVAVLPAEEVFETRNQNLYINSFMEVIAFALMYAMIYFLIKAIVVTDIRKINLGLARIINGDLDEKIDVGSTLEMNTLTGYINSTVNTLKASAQEVKDRIEKDMLLAANIQKSALPTLFPPYPEIKEFDIFAIMDPAREVGGDFYDFFLLGEERLAFIIADVSGKGIPAAMFMMRARTIIKSLAETGMAPEEIIYIANNKLCSENDTGMFVTAWLGILDYKTGDIRYVNAGHNPPLVGRKDLGFTYLKTRPCLVLAGMEDAPYRVETLKLEPGDRLFLYTDGVVESTSINNELYGEGRLQDYLNEHQDDPIDKIPFGIKEDIEQFIEGAEQFDDMTMLLLQYNGQTTGEPQPTEPEKKEEPQAAEPEKKEEPQAAEPEKKEEPQAAEPEKKEEPQPAEPEKKEESQPAEPEMKEEPQAAEPDEIGKDGTTQV